MSGIIKFSVKHPVSILMILTGITILGLISLTNISIDFIPIINERTLLVTTKYDGINAKEMKTLVTIPVENAFASLKGIKNITSTTRDDLSFVQIELHWGQDIDIALVESKQIIDQCYESLPFGCEKPDITIFNPTQKSTMQIAVEPLDNDLTYCRHIVDNELKQYFQRINGIARVSIIGGTKDEIAVNIRKDELLSKGLTIQDIAAFIENTNFEYPAGTIKDGDKELLLKTSGLYTSLNDLENTMILYNNGSVLQLKDIGYAKKSSQKEESFFIFNDKECILIELYKKNNASPLEISKKIRKELTEINKIYGKQYKCTIINDSSKSVKDSILQLTYSAILGIIITALVLLLFLKSFKSAFLISSIIPLSIIFTAIPLLSFGKTLNIISILGMTIGIGMVIDTSTITLENIQKKLSKHSRKDLEEKLIEAVEEVSLSSTSSSITTIIVFVPFFLFRGTIGELYSDMAISVISSISFSTLLSFTYIPAFVYILKKGNQKFLSSYKSINILEKKYKEFLTFVFNNKKILPLSFIICISLSTVLLISIKKEFFQTTQSKHTAFKLFFPENTSIEKMKAQSILISNELQKIHSVENIFITGGIDSENKETLSSPFMKKEHIQISITTSNPKEAIIHAKETFENTNYSVSIIEDDLLKELIDIKKDTFVLTSEHISEKAKLIAEDTASITPNSFVNEYVFSPNRIACSRFNITTSYISSLVKSTLEGKSASYFYENGRRIPIRVQFENSLNLKDIENMQVFIENAHIPLNILGNFNEEFSEKTLYRYNRKDAKLLVGKIQKEFLNTEELISLEKKQLNELFGDAAFIIAIIILLLYCTMGAQFESFLIPLIMLASLPPAFLGAFAALMLSRSSMNINTVIALTSLFGTSVNNAIILYENCKTLETVSVKNIIQACAQKLRGIIMTSATTVLAILPFAIDPLNKNPQSSVARAIIGGLILSLVFVCTTIPVTLHSVFHKKKDAKR